ncbi:thymidine kinase [Weissella cibaria]|uniref:thymidine kinase n=1 Tax=Weissella cibaria TaxID=137591 RepID=UPI000E54AD5E|nr:thymidine kinase [Weissella cibaria]RHE70154.1 thymidine kinase [Weissella cibaria]RHE76079.1 thymidine kinase [Weissella cibaria]
MSQLTFVYGTMASGKSIEILKVAHNYKIQGRHPLLLTSALDDRTKIGEVSSRIGLRETAGVIHDTDDLMALVTSADKLPDIVLLDEAQFMTRQQVIQLANVVDDLDIPVMAFGLKNDFSNRLFPGSEALLIFADKLQEMKTLDSFGTKKATMNLRIHDGKPVYEGEQIEIGGDEAYLPVSRYHYFHPDEQALAERFGK